MFSALHEFIIKLYKQAKKSCWLLLEDPKKPSIISKTDKREAPSIYPAYIYLYKLFFMITQVAYKGKFLYGSCLLNKWRRSDRIWMSPYFKPYWPRRWSSVAANIKNRDVLCIAYKFVVRCRNLNWIWFLFRRNIYKVLCHYVSADGNI